MPLIQSVDLDPGALLADPSPLADDTLALVVVSRREAFYKLSERGAVLAAGKLLPGDNSLRFTRPGLADGSQSLFFLLDLLEPGSRWPEIPPRPGDGRRQDGDGPGRKHAAIGPLPAGHVSFRPPVRLPEKTHGRPAEAEDRAGGPGARPGLERLRQPAASPPASRSRCWGWAWRWPSTWPGKKRRKGRGRARPSRRRKGWLRPSAATGGTCRSRSSCESNRKQRSMFSELRIKRSLGFEVRSSMFDVRR